MISIFKRLSFSSEKWKGDCSGKSLCGKQTAQWPLRRVPMGVSPPRNESAGRVTLLSLLPLQVLAGCNTRYDFSGYVETLHSSELMKKLQTLVPKRGPSVGAGAELRVFTVSEWRFRVASSFVPSPIRVIFARFKEPPFLSIRPPSMPKIQIFKFRIDDESRRPDYRQLASGCPPTRRELASDMLPSSSIKKHWHCVLPAICCTGLPLFYFIQVVTWYKISPHPDRLPMRRSRLRSPGAPYC